MVLEKLADPPLVEVVCGVMFEGIPEIDPLSLGGFHDAVRDRYPAHQLQPPLFDDGQVQFKGNFPPVRTWLISANDAWVLQIQWDRFYLNWRARAGAYPRFADHDGNEGVLSRMLRELESFREYCEKSFGAAVRLRALELTKVDHFEETKRWKGLDDLAAMLPWLAPFAAASLNKHPSVAAHFREERGGGVLTVQVEVGPGQAKLESRIVKKLDGDPRLAFEAANDVLNEVFDKLIPPDQRAKRFQGAGL